MDLKKFLPGRDNKEKIDHFWALVIEPGLVSAGIWRIQNQKAQVIYTSPPNPWEVDDDLVNAADAALSSAIQDYPQEYEEPQKTVFGVSYNWVLGGEIKEEYLAKIKKVCKELSLIPVGFVVLPEALSHLIKGEEGTPLNGIVLGVYKENIEVSLFQLGKLTGTTQVARSVSPVEDTVEGLTRLTTKGDSLPSRFLVYDGKEGDLEEIRQTLLNFGWEEEKNLKFLHTPKVDLIDPKRKIYAVSLAGASEIANVTQLEDVTEVQEPLPDETQEFVESEIPEDENVSPEELGFMMEKDIQEEKGKLNTDNPPEIEKSEEAETDLSTEESNVSPVDMKEVMAPAKTPKKHFSLEGLQKGMAKAGSFITNLGNKRRENLEETVQSHSKTEQYGMKQGVAPLAKAGSFMKGIGRFRLPSVSLGGKPLFTGLVFLILLFFLLGVAWWFFPKATVTIYVSPKRLDETINLEVKSNVEESDYSAKVLKGEVQEKTTSGERTKDTTGTKTVGDRAKGEVNIYRVGPELNLSSGTLLNGPDKLKFSLDNSITIASGSASTPGVTKVRVTAQDIGAQYNLASGTTFSIGNYSDSDMEAKNEQAFSGGSSREISAVSKDDQDNLLKDLSDELKQSAIEELQDDLEMEKYLVEDSIEASEEDSTFSNKVGDEANTLKLTLTQKLSAVVVEKNELDKLASEVLKDRIPKGFVLRGEQVTYNFEKKESGSDSYGFELKISANLLPEIKTDEIAKKIAGKYPKLAQEYLNKESPGFVRAEIKITPVLPARLKTLPHIAKNIEVEVSAEK